MSVYFDSGDFIPKLAMLQTSINDAIALIQQLRSVSDNPETSRGVTRMSEALLSRRSFSRAEWPLSVQLADLRRSEREREGCAVSGPSSQSGVRSGTGVSLAPLVGPLIKRTTRRNRSKGLAPREGFAPRLVRGIALSAGNPRP